VRTDAARSEGARRFLEANDAFASSRALRGVVAAAAPDGGRPPTQPGFHGAVCLRCCPGGPMLAVGRLAMPCDA
jgi:hypothetical protein